MKSKPEQNRKYGIPTSVHCKRLSQSTLHLRIRLGLPIHSIQWHRALHTPKRLLQLFLSRGNRQCNPKTSRKAQDGAQLRPQPRSVMRTAIIYPNSVASAFVSRSATISKPAIKPKPHKSPIHAYRVCNSRSAARSRTPRRRNRSTRPSRTTMSRTFSRQPRAAGR